MNLFSKQLVAEATGTFALVFSGTGAIIANDVSGGAVTHVGIALTFGMIVLAVIYAIGDVSGAHINPAVTIAFVVAGRFPATKAFPYILCQCAGAVLASVLLRIMFPDHTTLGATLPAGAIYQTFIMEVVLTFLLMYVILAVSTGSQEKGITAGIAIGCVVGLEAMFGGPVSGASMNPARSLAPALATLQLQHLWVYIIAPIVGALAAVPICCCTHPTDCCSDSTTDCDPVTIES